MTDHDARTASLRQALADELERLGDLYSPQWRRAVERVPRHLFVPEFFRGPDPSNGVALWTPVSGDHDPDQWLSPAYENVTLVTQLDQHVTPHDVSEPVSGNPTSSSTLPGLVVLMLEYLDVADDTTVLEIGTGTGYSTALMCERLGDDRVTSIEVDPGVAAKAAEALRRVGHAPNLVVGDGLDGVPDHAPYDRVIATCSVRHIPRSWLDQTRPGGRILTTVAGWHDGSGLAMLEKGDDGAAEGRFLPGTISFMMARPHMPSPISDEDQRAALKAVPEATPRQAVVGPDIREDGTGRFIMQLAIPNAQVQRIRIDDGPWITYFIDGANGSAASLAPEAAGGWVVRQAGPVRLWDDVEASVGRWRDAGSPAQEHFRIRTDGRVQTVWLDTGDEPISWDLTI